MNSTSNIVCVFKTFFPHFLSNSSIFWFSNHRRQVYIESKANLVGVKAWKNWAKEVEGWEWKGNGSWIFEAKRSEFSSGSRWEVLVKGIVVRVVVIVIEIRIFKNARFFLFLWYKILCRIFVWYWKVPTRNERTHISHFSKTERRPFFTQSREPWKNMRKFSW